MKTLLNIGLIFFLLTTTAYAQITKQVLFLGNSYTAVNDLPTIVSALAKNTGDSLIHNQNLPGGFTLEGHSTDQGSLSLIQQGKWDYVVLQEQSQKPSWPISQVVTSVFPFADSLCKYIRQANPCAMPLFYMTWGRKNGDSYNCPNWPPVCTYKGMDSLLNLRYQMMADYNDAYVSPVGATWHYIRDHYPNIELYSADESHPSVAGSYAAACTFYSLIFQKDPTLITDDYNLDPVKAAAIRTAAKLIAFDSLSNWNVGKYIPEAQFSSSQSNDTMYFTNQSTYASTYKWNFGDGMTSVLYEPYHIYNSSGTYYITLEAFKCGKSDSSIQKEVVIINSIEPSESNIVQVYPNPVIDCINIELTYNQSLENIQIHSTTGALIEAFSSQSDNITKLTLSHLPKGVYLLSFDINGTSYQYKLIKQ